MFGEDVKIGEGREALSGERASLPSPNPTPPTPKTFEFIESPLSAFPVGRMPMWGVLGIVQGHVLLGTHVQLWNVFYL